MPRGLDRIPSADSIRQESLSALSSADFCNRISPEDQTHWPVNGFDFFSERGTLTLDVHSPELAYSLVGVSALEELQQQGFQPTNKPHITVINFASGQNLLGSLERYSPAGRQIILRDVERIARGQDWAWRPTGEIQPFVGRDQTMLKLIAMIDCPGVDKFYDDIESLVPGVEIERYPMHITLLKKAVGVHSQLEAKEKPMPSGVRKTILKTLRVEPSDELVSPGMESAVLRDGRNLSPPLSPELIANVSRDFYHIDVIGAAALGRRIALVPEALEHYLPGAGRPMKVSDLSPLEKAKIFDEEMEKSLAKLQFPDALSSRVITGAIIQIARFFNHPRLLQEAERRLAEDNIHYAVKMRSAGFLNKLGEELLRDSNTPVDGAEKVSGAHLQPEVKKVQLAA